MTPKAKRTIYNMKRLQTTATVLMVRPIDFRYNVETASDNYFMKKDERTDIQTRAAKEFDNYVELLKANNVNVIVVQDTIAPHTPDSIFPNNWFSTHCSGELVLYPMYAPNRRQERKRTVLEVIESRSGFQKVIDLTQYEKEQQFLEGTGSMILDRVNSVLYACKSERTSEIVIKEYCSKMNYRAVLFSSEDAEKQPIYHTNVMMCIGSKFSLICLESIRNEEERKVVIEELEKAGKTIIPISLDQVYHFTGNMIELQDKDGNPLIIVSKQGYDALNEEQKKQLSRFGKFVTPDLKTIETIGGGSARCMVAEIFF